MIDPACTPLTVAKTPYDKGIAASYAGSACIVIIEDPTITVKMGNQVLCTVNGNDMIDFILGFYDGSKHGQMLRNKHNVKH